MSVRVCDREPSEVQYLYLANQLKTAAVNQCAKLPPKFRDATCIPIVLYSYRVYECCCFAERISLHNKELLTTRSAKIKEAQSCLDCLEDALIQLRNKLVQNPENYDKQNKAQVSQKLIKIYGMLKDIGKMICLEQDLLSAQLVLTQQAMVQAQ